MAVDDRGRSHLRYGDLIPLPGMTGDLADMALYAGQSVELVRDIRPAEAVVRDLIAQTVAVIDELHRGTGRSR